MDIQFIGFDYTEVDTFLLTQYEPNGLFNEPIDSFYTYLNQPNADTIRYHFSDPQVDLGNHMEIKLPNISRVFRIAYIDIKKTDCNCGPGVIRQVTGYSLNGVKMNTDVIEMKK